jgi:hypothetical protein
MWIDSLRTHFAVALLAGILIALSLTSDWAYCGKTKDEICQTDLNVHVSISRYHATYSYSCTEGSAINNSTDITKNGDLGCFVGEESAYEDDGGNYCTNLSSAQNATKTAVFFAFFDLFICMWAMWVGKDGNDFTPKGILTRRRISYVLLILDCFLSMTSFIAIGQWGEYLNGSTSIAVENSTGAVYYYAVVWTYEKGYFYVLFSGLTGIWLMFIAYRMVVSLKINEVIMLEQEAGPVAAEAQYVGGGRSGGSVDRPPLVVAYVQNPISSSGTIDESTLQRPLIYYS